MWNFNNIQLNNKEDVHKIDNTNLQDPDIIVVSKKETNIQNEDIHFFNRFKNILKDSTEEKSNLEKNLISNIGSTKVSEIP